MRAGTDRKPTAGPYGRKSDADATRSLNAADPMGLRVSNPDRFARNFEDPAFPIKVVSYGMAKRAFDVITTSAILLVLWPLMLAIAIAIKITSRGPIVFKQVRVGEGGRHFWCYKFRSMCADAEDRKKELMHLNEASGPVFKIKRDPRITRIGALIRKTSLDELPQLFNVLKGDMSLVGPRPAIPSEVAQYQVWQRRRLRMRPGLTCLWALNGRDQVDFETWMKMDMQYIDNWSLSLDWKILFQTIPQVVLGKGAH